jgi:hypothetical protein
VNTRLKRLDKALEGLTDDINDANSAQAAKGAKVVRRQLAAAWRGARYYIKNAPPPPAEDARKHRARRGVRRSDLAPSVRAKLSQDGALVIADPVTTAMAVFDGYHAVATTMIELSDGARVPVLDSVSRTLFLSLDRRDKAIEDVHTLAPPPPAEEASVHAKAAQEEGAPAFDTSMPALTMWLDDEVQHIDGLLADATDLRPGARRTLGKASSQIGRTRTRIDTYWPPVVGD